MTDKQRIIELFKIVVNNKTVGNKNDEQTVERASKAK